MNKLGQYFTTNKSLKQHVKDFILNTPSNILEPSIGRGDLINFVLKNNPTIVFDMYEIDDTIKLLKGIKKENIHYGNFLEQNIQKKYKTIIGNPPYVKTSTGNLFIDFINKCYHLLEDKGELVFIIPSDFFKLTRSCQLLNEMLENGSFTHIYYPNKENLFKNASIDVLVFRYCKDKSLPKKILYNGIEKYIINNNGLVTFEEQNIETKLLFKDYFNIYVGIVSGKDAIYKNRELGNIKVLYSKGQYEKFIYIENYPSNNTEIDNYLLLRKEELKSRKIKKFTDDNWYEWGAPRNIRKMEANKGKACIYIHNLTRKEDVAFIGEVDYFGGNLLILIPKIECDLKKAVEYLNSIAFRNNFIYSGRFKIGQRQLVNSVFNV